MYRDGSRWASTFAALMERAKLLSIGLFWLGSAFGQMVVPAGTNLTVDENTSLRIDAPLTWTLEAGSGFANNGGIVLGPDANLDEALSAAITGTGTERTMRDLSSPLVNENPGGLGGIISTNASLGNTSIVRGHVPFTDYSGHTSLARWIDFTPANNTGLNAALTFRDDPAELNGLVEAEQRLHIRASQNVWWFFASAVNTGAHTVTSSGLDSLGTFTTFDVDLPNSVTEQDAGSSFALLGAPGEALFLRVPAGMKAETLDIFAVNGSCVATIAPHWNAGTHALPGLVLCSGVYQLRVNGEKTIPFLQP